MEFEKARGRRHGFLYTVHARSMDVSLTVPCTWSAAVHFDLADGNVCYPVRIEPDVPGVVIILDSESAASAQMPPSVPESMVDMVRDQLGHFRDIVSDAQKFIENQRSELEKERKNGESL